MSGAEGGGMMARGASLGVGARGENELDEAITASLALAKTRFRNPRCIGREGIDVEDRDSTDGTGVGEGGCAGAGAGTEV